MVECDLDNGSLPTPLNFLSYDWRGAWGRWWIGWLWWNAWWHLYRKSACDNRVWWLSWAR